MEIISINKNNIDLLKKFNSNILPVSFRYFKTRNLDCIKNHVLTLIGSINNKPISYAHIDNEENINWIGICVLNEYQSKGYGKKLFEYVINYIYTNNISNVQLSVDISNYKALNLYLKYGFKVNHIKKDIYIMQLNSNNIFLNVSLGEALDKLTILHIKLEKITDSRKKDVEYEYNILNKELNTYVINYNYYYKLLKKINLNIWEMQDDFRYNKGDKVKLCFKIIEENDRRFRIKKKINDAANSSIKEQKGYNIKKAFVLTHLGLGDNITANGMVRYLSTKYDQVVVVVKHNNLSNLKQLYSDDQSIKFYPIHNDREISPAFGCPLVKFNEITKDHDVYTCGFHKHSLNISYGDNNLYDMPFSFYNDVDVPISAFWEYFHVPTLSESENLYEIVKNIDNYIFVHNTSSNGNVFSIEFIEEKFNINRQNTLIINPCKNVYNNNDKFFEVAQLVLNKSLLEYKLIIENANKIILSDSSFMCMAINLENKTDECYIYQRDYKWNNKPYLYEHIWNNKYIFDKSLKRKIFKCLN